MHTLYTMLNNGKHSWNGTTALKLFINCCTINQPFVISGGVDITCCSFIWARRSWVHSFWAPSLKWVVWKLYFPGSKAFNSVDSSFWQRRPHTDDSRMIILVPIIKTTAANILGNFMRTEAIVASEFRIEFGINNNCSLIRYPDSSQNWFE